MQRDKLNSTSKLIIEFLTVFKDISIQLWATNCMLHIGQCFEFYFNDSEQLQNLTAKLLM